APPAPTAATPAVMPPVPPPTVIVTPPAAISPTVSATPPLAVAPAPVPAAPPAVAPPAPSAPSKGPGAAVTRKQWARVDGKVQSVEGALLVLKSDDGTLVTVDISQLNPSVSQALRLGRVVSVYGYPVAQKFEAAGYIELDPSHPEPPRLKWNR